MPIIKPWSNIIIINYFSRRHFSRTTVSLGDHNVKTYNDARSTFRKIRRIIRFPTYDNNLIDGDLALLHLTDPVQLSGVAFQIENQKPDNLTLRQAFILIDGH